MSLNLSEIVEKTTLHDSSAAKVRNDYVTTTVATLQKTTLHFTAGNQSVAWLQWSNGYATRLLKL